MDITTYKAGFALLVAFVFSGCASQRVMSKTSETIITEAANAIEVTSVPEDFQSFIISGKRICVMPTPPASFGETGPSLKFKGEEIDSGSISSSNRDLGANTYLTDQILYRLCEMGLSYDFTKEEMSDYFIKTLTIIDELTGQNFDVSTAEDVLDNTPKKTNTGEGK
jgi:hypothetical protein